MWTSPYGILHSYAKTFSIIHGHQKTIAIGFFRQTVTPVTTRQAAVGWCVNGRNMQGLVSTPVSDESTTHTRVLSLCVVGPEREALGASTVLEFCLEGQTHVRISLSCPARFVWVSVCNAVCDHIPMASRAPPFTIPTHNPPKLRTSSAQHIQTAHEPR